MRCEPVERRNIHNHSGPECQETLYVSNSIFVAMYNIKSVARTFVCVCVLLFAAFVVPCARPRHLIHEATYSSIYIMNLYNSCFLAFIMYFASLILWPFLISDLVFASFSPHHLCVLSINQLRLICACAPVCAVSLYFEYKSTAECRTECGEYKSGSTVGCSRSTTTVIHLD